MGVLRQADGLSGANGGGRPLTAMFCTMKNGNRDAIKNHAVTGVSLYTDTPCVNQKLYEQYFAKKPCDFLSVESVGVAASAVEGPSLLFFSSSTSIFYYS